MSIQTRKYDVRRIRVAALAGGTGAAVLNVALYLVTHAAGVEFVGRFQGPDAPAAPLPGFMVALSSIVPSIFAAALLTLLNRLMARPTPVFFGVAGVFLGVSMWGPIAVGDATTGTKVVLAFMHVVAGVAICSALYARARIDRST